MRVRTLDCPHYIGGIAARRDRDQQIAGAKERLKLPNEDIVEGPVIRNGTQSDMWSGKLMHRKGVWPSHRVASLKSFAQCDAVAALPPLPTTKTA